MKQIWYRKTRMVLMASVLFLLASCIDGYHDDWTFSSGVKNTTLLSPDSSKVVFSKDTKGNLVVTWPVIYGAGGYQFSLYIVDDPANPVAVGAENELIDGCSATRALEEDTKYKVVIKTLGNEKVNNKTSIDSTVVPYSTLLPAYKVIPDGTDLYQYFVENPIPDSTNELAYELVANGKYTLSDQLDFGKHWITLRGNKVFHPTITYGTNGRLRTYTGLTIKYLDVDCNALAGDVANAAMLLMSGTPDQAIYSTVSKTYMITKDIFLYKCNFKNINRRLISDGGLSYSLKTLSISNCKVDLNALTDDNGGIIYFYTAGGFVNDFTIKNSTVWSSVKSGGYFLRYNNGGRPDKAGYISSSINFYNNTFYNVVYNKQMANYDGMKLASVKLKVLNNIFCDCGSGEVIRRLSASSTNMVREFGNNCYWFNGAFPIANEVDRIDGDKSATAYGVNPQFKDPANGDFTISSSVTDIITHKSGDPRWLPAQ